MSLSSSTQTKRRVTISPVFLQFISKRDLILYHLERNQAGSDTDIVINGFENGIADSPYQGIADMRNVNITTMPGEVSVNFATAGLNVPPAVSAAAFTTNAGTNLATWSGAVTLYNGCAITINSQATTNLSTGRVYWVGNVTSTTFQVYASPSRQAGQLIALTTGSGTFSTYTLSKFTYSTTDYAASGNRYVYHYFIDVAGLVWWIDNTGGVPTNNLIYLGNTTLGAGQGIAVLNQYLLVFRGSNIDYINGGLIDNGGIDFYTQWAVGVGWLNIDGTNPSNHQAITGRDLTVYFCNSGRIGSIIEKTPGGFAPGTPATYTSNNNALQLPDGEKPTYIAEYSNLLLIGGVKNIVYPWDRISISYASPLVLSEYNTTRIVSTNQNSYIFIGTRGRIYTTNGTSINLFKKIPDNISGAVEPYFMWTDAVFWRGQLYFGFSVSKNDGTALTTGGGLWAIDLDSNALRQVNTVSDGSSGVANVIQPNLMTTTPSGMGIFMGWSNGGTIGLDRQLSTPYTGGQTTIDSDMIPVGQYLTPYTPNQVEWKTTIPLGNNGTSESIQLLYRTDISQTYTAIGTSTSSTGLINGRTAVSDIMMAGFQGAQWVQLRAVLTSTATTPTFVRMKEFRIRSSDNDQDYSAAIQNANL